MRISKLLTIISFLLIPLYSVAEEQISFKGIKFGMMADEIAKLGGGDTKYGCSSAIAKGENPWTYGGIDKWSASCVEAYDEKDRAPGTSGLFEIRSTVSSHRYHLAKSVGKKTYSVEELAEIFSTIFGKFHIETEVLKNGLGQEFIKKKAMAMRGGAVMNIADSTFGKDHENYIDLEITSLDYLSKKSAWEQEKNSQKMKDAKSDF